MSQWNFELSLNVLPSEKKLKQRDNLNSLKKFARVSVSLPLLKFSPSKGGDELLNAVSKSQTGVGWTRARHSGT